MNQNILILVAIAVAIVLVTLANRKSAVADIAIPAAPQRKDLLFGYYGCYGNQVAETAGGVNLLWATLWGDGTRPGDAIDQAITDMRAENMTTVLDVGTVIIGPAATPRAMADGAEAALRALFARLKAAGVLHLVRFIVPCDEPNLRKDGTIDLMPTAAALIRRVAAEFPELAGVKLGVIYATPRFNPMEHIELFDVVGFDDYDLKSSIFAPGGMYEQMRARLRPDQRTWILPGACYGQDPAPFLNFANANPEVCAIVPFLWCTVPWESAFKGIVDQPAMRAQYEALGKLIVSAHA